MSTASSSPAQEQTPPPPGRGELGAILGAALRAGQLMLENGANTSRVEDVVTRLGLALGAHRLDVYVTPSGIVASAVAAAEHRTRTIRILRTAIDLHRVAQVVALTSQAEKAPLTVAGARAELERIAASPRLFGPLLTVPSIGLACAAFALLFGTTWVGAVAAGAAAASGQALRELLGRVGVGRLMTTVLVAFVTSALALFNARLTSSTEAGLVIAASVLLLVPGALMISSVGDLFRGDTVSGLARATSAGLVILAMGTGLWLTLAVFHAPLVPGPDTLQAPLLAVGLALIATAGFALLFDVPVRALAIASLIGAVGYGVRAFAGSLGVGAEGSVFLAGVALAALAEVAGRALGFPSNIFTIPAFIPLVPGVTAFRSVLHLAAQDYPSGTAALVQTLLWVGALAAGVGLVQAVTSRTRSGF